MLSVVCPGQGSQRPGMLTDWIDFDPDRALPFLSSLSEAAGLDLVELGTSASADTITDTANAQPLIVAASLLSYELFSVQAASHGVIPITATAGHSVGEFTACCVAERMSPTDATALVAKRGAAMAQVARDGATGMAAIVGGNPPDVLRRLEELDLVGANINGGGQIVAAGLLSLLDELRNDPPPKTKVIPLAVAGAFHTDYMDEAKRIFASHVQATLNSSHSPVREINSRSPALLTNSDGHILTTDDDLLALLTEQITHPVRWDNCQSTLVKLGTTGVLELAPAGVLTGLARRTMPKAATFALKSPEDLGLAVAFAQEHACDDALVD